MEADKTLIKIKKLKPNATDVKPNNKQNKLYKMLSSMYKKNYNLQIEKKM